jgi:hypothetical protein
VTIGEQETTELMKVYEAVKLLAEKEAKEKAA